MPFDWKTPFGYLMALAIMYLVLMHLYMFDVAVISFEVGCYLWLMEFVKDIQNETNLFNETVKFRENRSQILKKQLCDSIQFHSQVKQLSVFFFQFYFKILINIPVLNISNDCLILHFFKSRLVHDISDIAQPMFTALFGWSITTIGITLLIVQIQLVQ